MLLATVRKEGVCLQLWSSLYFQLWGDVSLHMMCGCSDGAVTVGGEGGEGECFWKKGWAEMDFSGALFKYLVIAIRYAQQWHL